MKSFTNQNGVVITRGDTFKYNHAFFKVEKIYRNRLGVVKVLTTNGVIFDAQKMKKVETNEDSRNT